MSRTTLAAGAVDAAAAKWPRMVEKFAKKGLILQLMMVDPATRELRSLTVWESEAIMRAQEARVDASDFAREFEPFYETPIEFSYFEPRSGFIDVDAFIGIAAPGKANDIWFHNPQAGSD
ncbi:MAG: hypothetical protein AB1440_11905 [Pseudomonadota bacterium]